MDHFIPAVNEIGSNHNGFRRAVKLRNALDNAIGPCSKPDVVEMLVRRFPTYRKNAQGSWKSLLGRLFRHGLYTAAEILIITHEPTNPLYDLVCCHNDPTDVCCKTWLDLIFEHYTPSTQIKLCLQKISNDGAFQNYRPRSWLPVVMNYLRRHSRYGLDFVTRAIGGTYSIYDPLCLRYNKCGRNLWIAQELRNMNLVGDVNITRDETGTIFADNIPISCPELHHYLETQSRVQFPFSIELDKILGIGGESIVFRHPVDGIARALKVAPYEKIANDEKQVIQQAQQKLRSRSGQLDLENEMCESNLDLVNKTAEFGITTLTHKNLIHYHNIIIDVVHGQFAYIIRKL